MIEIMPFGPMLSISETITFLYYSSVSPFVVINLIQHIPQPFRINLPTPVGRFHMRIFNIGRAVAGTIRPTQRQGKFYLISIILSAISTTSSHCFYAASVNISLTTALAEVWVLCMAAPHSFNFLLLLSIGTMMSLSIVSINA